MTKLNDSIYEERNLLVQLLAAVGEKVGWTISIVKEDSEWHILYIDTDHGQLSWHIRSEQLQAEWTEKKDVWDGHTTAEKYQRIENMIKIMVNSNGR